MKVLVTGCHGFVGHYVCRELDRQGIEFMGTERLHAAISYKDERIKRAVPGMQVLSGDISDEDFLTKVFFKGDITHIIHCAAQFPIKHNLQAVNQYIASNLAGFLRLLEYARLLGVQRVIYTSSITAATKGKPTNLYGATKKFNEEAAHVFAKHGLETVGLRLAQVYGPMMRVDGGIWRLGQMVKTNRPIPDRMTGFGNKRSQVYIEDAAKTLVSALRVSLPELNPIATVCADDYLADYGDIVYALSTAMGKEVNNPKGYTLTPRTIKADVEPLERLRLHIPRTNLEDGMKILARYL